MTKETLRSEQMEKLLVYLLIYREKRVSLQELMDVLWEDGVDHPQKALKNLVYRLRNGLKKLGSDSYIITNQGNYFWNPEIPVILDTELFEEWGEKAMQCQGSREERCARFEKALSWYQGNYLPEFSMETWQIPLDTYYHSLYLSIVKELAGLYNEGRQYKEMGSLLRKALERDNIDDELHYWNIMSLMGQGKIDLAWSHYKKAKELLYRNLGIIKSERMSAIHQELISVNQVIDSNMDGITEDMTEQESPRGVYFCEYEIFREIYRLEARRIMRFGIAEYILLLTLQLGNTHGKTQEYISHYKRKNVAYLKKTLEESLRMGDVASVCSENQYIVMLPTCTYENGVKVAQRVTDRFREICTDRNVQLVYELKAMEPNQMQLL